MVQSWLRRLRPVIWALACTQTVAWFPCPSCRCRPSLVPNRQFDYKARRGGFDELRSQAKATARPITTQQPAGLGPQAEMWPPLPSGTPITPLPKEYSRLLAKPGEGAPGIPLKDVKAKHLEGASLDFVHPVDLDFPGLRVVHLDPLVLVVENFLTGEECDELISLSADPEAAMQVASPTFGGALAMTGQRTSTTWFLRYASARNLVERNAALLQLADTDGRRRFEEPQLVRYGPGQQFKWHLDQVPAGEQLDNGGQRLATTLVRNNGGGLAPEP